MRRVESLVSQLRYAFSLVAGGHMQMTLECEQEAAGRWLAEVPQLPGVMAYGTSANEAMVKAQVLALRVLAERREYGEAPPATISMTVPAVADALALL